MDKRAPLLLIGAGRSGTTLLTRSLNAHPDISFIGETDFLVPRIWKQVYDNRFWLNWRRYQLTNPNSARGILDELPENELAALREKIGSMIADFVVKLLDVNQKAKVWGYKELWNGSESHDYPWTAFDSVFSKATWVHLVRNPFDFARSCAQWNKVPLDQSYLQNSLKDWVAIIHKSRSRRETGRFVEVRFETMLASPKNVLTQIFDLVNLGLSENCLAPFSKPTFTSKMNSFAKGPTLLHSDLKVLIENIPYLRDLMKELGYSAPDVVETQVSTKTIPPIMNLRTLRAEEHWTEDRLLKTLKAREAELEACKAPPASKKARITKDG